MEPSVNAVWAAEIDNWGLALGAAGRSRHTIYLRSNHVKRLGRWAESGPWQIQGEQLVSWLGGQDWDTSTKRAFRSSLRGFYAWGHGTGRIGHNPALELPTVPVKAPSPRPTPEDAYRLALVEAPPREYLMLRLAAECGLRRAEVACVHSNDLIQDLTGWSLIVHGKGNKIRVVPLPAVVARRLRELPEGYAFPGGDDGHLSPWWVGTLISRLLPEGWTMHTLRHRAATRWYSVDNDLLTVQQLLGHASPNTTQAYVAVPDVAKRRLVEAMAL